MRKFYRSLGKLEKISILILFFATTSLGAVIWIGLSYNAFATDQDFVDQEEILIPPPTPIHNISMEKKKIKVAPSKPKPKPRRFKKPKIKKKLLPAPKTTSANLKKKVDKLFFQHGPPNKIQHSYDDHLKLQIAQFIARNTPEIKAIKTDVLTYKTNSAIQKLKKLVHSSRYKSLSKTYKIQTLLTLASTLIYLDPKSSLNYYKKVLNLDKNNLMALTQVARLSEKNNNHTDSIKFYKKALAISRANSNIKQEGIILEGLGTAYVAAGNITIAIEYFQKSIEVNKKSKNLVSLGNIYGVLGLLYAERDDLKLAEKYHLSALEVSRKLNNKYGETVDLGNLGNVYLEMGEPKKAIEYHKKSLKINKQLYNREGESKDLGNLGNAYADLGDWNEAIKYHIKSLQISREINLDYDSSLSLGNLGSIYFKLQKWDKSIFYYKQALEIFTKLKSPDAKLVQELISTAEQNKI